MLPLRLEMKNFLAYRSPDPLRFDGIHLACLTGANGAGKTSLLDAITWALWGKARAKRDDDLVHLGQTDMYVQLDFEHEGAHYRVLRQRTRKSSGQSRLEFFNIDADGALHTLSGGGIKVTQAQINQMLRLDYETFVNSAFLQQGRADAFTIKTPAERKRLLSDMLGLDRWRQYEDRVKERMREINDAIIGVETLIQDIDNELAQEPGLHREVADAEAAEAEARAALDIAESRLAEVASATSDLKHAQENRARLDGELQQHRADLAEVTQKIAEHQQRIAGFEATIAAETDIEAGYQRLQAARELDEQFGDKVDQLRVIEQGRQAALTALNRARADLEKQVSGFTATISQLERVVSGAQPDKLTELRAEVRRIEALEQKRETLRAAETILKEEKSGLNTENKRLRDDMAALKERIDRLRDATGATCPLCGQPLSEADRLGLVAQLEGDGKTLGDTYRANRARVSAIDDELKTNKATIADLADDIARLEGLREEVGKLQGTVDDARRAATQLDAVRAQLATTQHTLSDEAFGGEIRAQLAAFDEQEAALGYDSDQHSAARATLKTFRDYGERYTELQRARDAVTGQREQLEAVEARRARLEKVIDRVTTEQAALDDQIALLHKQVEEYHLREQEMRDQLKNEQVAHDRLVIARQALDALDKRRQRKDRLQAERAALRADRTLYAELQLAFSKNGIPAMMIEAAIPELETNANAILARMTDGRMNIKLETQKEKISGGMAETLDIHIADELGTRAYEMYSGGEAFRINFALRVALSQLLARRAGAHLQTLFIDEGFGTQDGDGRDKLVEAITAVQREFNLILVITHIEELRDSFPVHITLAKTADGSRISVR